MPGDQKYSKYTATLAFWPEEYTDLNSTLEELSKAALEKAGARTIPSSVADNILPDKLEEVYSRLIADRLATNNLKHPLYWDSDATTIVTLLGLTSNHALVEIELADRIIANTQKTIARIDSNPRTAYNMLHAAIAEIAITNGISVNQVVCDRAHRASVIQRCMSPDSWLAVMLTQTHDLELARDSAGILEDLVVNLAAADRYRVTAYMQASYCRELSRLINEYVLAIKCYYIRRSREIWPS